MFTMSYSMAGLAKLHLVRGLYALTVICLIKLSPKAGMLHNNTIHHLCLATCKKKYLTKVSRSNYLGVTFFIHFVAHFFAIFPSEIT